MDAVRRTTRHIDESIGSSTFGRIFRLEGSGHEKEIENARFFSEIRAGLTTFFTMAYIIAVNASILSDSGGTCVCKDPVDPTCMGKNDFGTEYSLCLLEIRRDIITATAAISGLSSFLFGFLTNIPVALAPGMGLNAYFAYQVVGFHGTGSISYGLALAAVFIEGFIFFFLSLLGMRQWLVRLLPASIKVASGCGIGLFLTLIGLSYSTGIGAITGGGAATPLDLAGCPMEYYDATLGICKSHKMQSPTLWIGLFLGGILTLYLMSYKVKSAIIIGILVVSIVSWPRPTSFTYFPHTPEGDARFEFFKNVVSPRGIKHTLNAIDWQVMKAPSQFALALFTFLYVDIIDCTATLYSMARFSGIVDPDTGSFPRSTIAYCTDASCISIGALFGTSPVTAFIESGAGIAEGGKTGLTAMTTGICFLISILFAPIFASIPPWATGCTLVIVGCMMMRQVVMVNWRYIGDALPAFVTLMFMPFSYSIAYGLIAGLFTYVVINTMTYLTTKLSGGRIIPEDEDHREYWTLKPAGTLPWFIRAVQDPHGFFSLPGSGSAGDRRPSAGSAGHGSQESSSFDAKGMMASGRDEKGLESVVVGQEVGKPQPVYEQRQPTYEQRQQVYEQRHHVHQHQYAQQQQQYRQQDYR